MVFPEASPEFQFHLLRHFRFCDEAFLKDLSHTLSLDIAELKQQMKMQGSFFKQEFAENPVQLYHRLLSEISAKKIKAVEEDQKIIFQILFTKDEYTNGIGLDALINMEQVEQQQNLYRSERAGFSVWMLQGELRPSWQANLVFSKEEQTLLPRTAFPGIFAPSFPDKTRMNKSAFLNAQKFWDNHAFIVP